MARVEYGAMITELKGSVGGFTFQQNSAGKIVRARPKTFKNSTPKQTVAQSLHMDFIARWLDLSLANRILWNDFAALHTKENMFGEVKTLTGMNWYESINQNRQRMGLGILEQPPVYALPAAPPAYNVLMDQVDLKIEFDPAFTPVGTDLFIWTTGPVSRVTTSLRKAFRATSVETGDNYGIIDLKADWIATHNIPYPPSSQANCFQVGILVQSCLQSSGICSAGVLNIDATGKAVTGVGFWGVDTTFVVS